MSWADTRVCPYGLHASINLCYFAHKLFFLAPLIALAYRAPRGTNCVCATRDYSLLVLSIGQFVLLRPQIVFFCPIDSTRLQRPAWHKLRLCYTRLFAARAIYRSICVTSPTNCPIELRPNSAALGIIQVNLPSALACTNFHHDVVRGAIFTLPRGCPTHHDGCCRAERLRPWCLLWYY